MSLHTRAEPAHSAPKALPLHTRRPNPALAQALRDRAQAHVRLAQAIERYADVIQAEGYTSSEREASQARLKARPHRRAMAWLREAAKRCDP